MSDLKSSPKSSLRLKFKVTSAAAAAAAASSSAAATAVSSAPIAPVSSSSMILDDHVLVSSVTASKPSVTSPIAPIATISSEPVAESYKRRSSILKFSKKAIETSPSDETRMTSTKSPNEGGTRKKEQVRIPLQRSVKSSAMEIDPSESTKNTSQVKIESLSHDQNRKLALMAERFGFQKIQTYKTHLTRVTKAEKVCFPAETPNAPSFDEWLLDLALGAPVCTPGVFERSFKMARLLAFAPKERLFAIKGVPDIDEFPADNLYPMDERGAIESSLVIPHIIGEPYSIKEFSEFCPETSSMNLVDLNWGPASQIMARKLRVLDNFYVCDKSGVQVPLHLLPQLYGAINGSASLQMCGSSSSSSVFPSPVPGIQAFGTLVGGLSSHSDVGEVRGRLAFPHRWRFAVGSLRLHAVFAWKASRIEAGEVLPDDGKFGLDYLGDQFPVSYDKKRKLLITQKRYRKNNSFGAHRRSIVGLMEDKSRKRANILNILKNASGTVNVKNALENELEETSTGDASPRELPKAKKSTVKPTSFPTKKLIKSTYHDGVGLPPLPLGQNRMLTSLECHQRAAAVRAIISLPILFGVHLGIESIGRIDPRPTYHTERFIFPVGFRSTRYYVDYTSITQRVKYVCDILDGGDLGPLFLVTNPRDPLNPASHRSSTGAWKEINSRVQNAKHHRKGTKNSAAGGSFVGAGGGFSGGRTGSGPDLFMFSSGLPLTLIEGLPNAVEYCPNYTFQEQRTVFMQKELDQNEKMDDSSESHKKDTETGKADNDDEDDENGEEEEDEDEEDDGKGVLATKRNQTPAQAAKSKRIRKAVREIVLDLLSNDANSSLSLRTIRLRTESVLGISLALEDDRLYLRQVVQAVASGSYDADADIDDTDDENVDNNNIHENNDNELEEEDDDEAEVDAEDEEGEDEAEGEEDEDDADEEDDVEDEGAVAVGTTLKRPREKVSGKSSKSSSKKTLSTTGDFKFGRLTSSEDKRLPPFRQGNQLPRVRIHLQSILGCEIVISGPLTKVSGGPVLLLHTPGAAYIIATGNPFFSPSPERFYRLAARPKLQLFETAILIYHHIFSQSGATSFKYTDVIRVLEKVSRVSVLRELDMNDVHSSGKPVVEDYLISNVSEIRKILNESVIPEIAKGSPAENARNNLLNALEFKKEVRKRSPDPKRIESLLDVTELYVRDPKHKKIAVSLLENPSDFELVVLACSDKNQEELEKKDKEPVIEKSFEENVIQMADMAPTNYELVPSVNLTVSDDKARPSPGYVFEPNLVPQSISDQMLEFWAFFQVYSNPLGLSTVRLDDFVAAFVSPFPTGIVTRCLISLMRVIVYDRGIEEDRFQGSTLSSGTWQEHLRIIIENCLSLSDRSKLSLLLAASGDLDSKKSLSEPPLGPVLSLCKDALLLISSEGQSSVLRNPIQETDVGSSSAKKPFITLTGIEERLCSGFYGTFLDHEESINGSVDRFRRLMLPYKDGGVSGGASAAPSSGYRGFLNDVRLMFSNYKAVLKNDSSRSYGSLIDVVPFLFEDNVSARILSTASLETSQKRTKVLNEERRKAISSRNEFSIPAISSTSTPTLVECALSLYETNFSLLPIEIRMEILSWIINKALQTRLIRTYTDVVAEAEHLSKQTLAGCVASKNKGSAPEASDFLSASVTLDSASLNVVIDQYSATSFSPRVSANSIIDIKKRVLSLFSKKILSQDRLAGDHLSSASSSFHKLAEQVFRIDPSFRDLATSDSIRPFLEALKTEEDSNLRRASIDESDKIDLVSVGDFKTDISAAQNVTAMKSAYLKSSALYYKTESAKGSKRITSVNSAALKLLSTRLNEIGHDRFGRSYFLLDDIGLHPSVPRKDITTRTALRVFTLDPQKSHEGLRAFSKVEDIQRLVDWLRADIYNENKAREAILSLLPSLSKRIVDATVPPSMSASYNTLCKNPSLSLCSFLFPSVSEAAHALLAYAPVTALPEDEGDGLLLRASISSEVYTHPCCAVCKSLVSNRWFQIQNEGSASSAASSESANIYSGKAVSACEPRDSKTILFCLTCYTTHPFEELIAASSLTSQETSIVDHVHLYEPSSPSSLSLPKKLIEELEIPRGSIKDAKLPAFLRCFPNYISVNILHPKMEESNATLSKEVAYLTTQPTNSEVLKELLPLQMLLLQTEVRLCNPRFMTLWRYSKQRHQWRVNVATAGWNKLGTTFQSSDSTSQIQNFSPVAFSKSIPNDIVGRALSSRVKILADSLLLLEGEVHRCTQHSSVPSGVVRSTWAKERGTWRAKVASVKTESRLYLLANIFSNEAIDYLELEDQVSEIDRNAFLTLPFEKGGVHLGSSVAASNAKSLIIASEMEALAKFSTLLGPFLPGKTISEEINKIINGYLNPDNFFLHTASSNVLTSMGNNSLFGSALSAFVPKTGDTVIYYGEGFAEAIDHARKSLKGTDVGSSASIKRLNRTCSNILSQLSPVSGTAICKVGRITYHQGASPDKTYSPEPYAKVTLHVEKWLHSAPAESFNQVVPNVSSKDAIGVFGSSSSNGASSSTQSPRSLIKAALSPELEEFLQAAVLDKDSVESQGLQTVEAENGAGSGPSGLVIQEANCTCCGTPGDVLGCDFPRCGRFYHFPCIGYKSIEQVPDTYICPAHSCADCCASLTDPVAILNEGTNCAATCISCPTSYCVSCFNRVSQFKTFTGERQIGPVCITKGTVVWSSSELPNGLSQWQCQACSVPSKFIKHALRRVVLCMRNQDTLLQFTDPVNDLVYPDYYEKIGGKKNSMSISQIEEKIEASTFESLADFLTSCKLIITNVDKYSRANHGRYNYLVPTAKAVVQSGLRQICDETTLSKLIIAFSQCSVSPKSALVNQVKFNATRVKLRQDIYDVATAMLSHYQKNKSLTSWELPSGIVSEDVISAVASIKNDVTTSPEICAIADDAVNALATQPSMRSVVEFNVVIRLRALMSDFVIPLDRYLAAASHKFTINEVLATFRLDPPQSLKKDSGGPIVYHPTLWKKIFTLSETILGASAEEIDKMEPLIDEKPLKKKIKPGKVYVAPTYPKRKALNDLVTLASAGTLSMIEARKSILRKGRVYIGHVAGSLVIAPPPRSSGELSSIRNHALRYCAVPWKSLLIHWCDFSVLGDLQTSLSSLWEARNGGQTVSLSSKSVQREFHRVNPWDFLEDFIEVLPEQQTETLSMDKLQNEPTQNETTKIDATLTLEETKEMSKDETKEKSKEVTNVKSKEEIKDTKEDMDTEPE